MKKIPKYILLPVALAIYFVAMLVVNIHANHGALPQNFAGILAIEAAVLLGLFFALRYLHNRRKQ